MPEPAARRVAVLPPSQFQKGSSILAALAVAAFLGLGVYGKLLTKAPVDQIEPIPGDYQAIGEAVVALLLIVLHRWGVMWAFTAMLFSVFSGVALHRLLQGAESCGCFGGIKIPPHITLSLDAAIVCMSAWLARAWGLRTWGFAAAFGLVPSLVVAGAMYSRHATPPSADEADFGAIASEDQGAAIETGRITAREALLRVPAAFDRGAFPSAPAPEWLDDLRKAADPDAGLPWLIYVYNRNCDVCQRHLPEWTDARQIYEEDLAAGRAAAGVLLIEWEDLIEFKIPTWAWGAHTPITLLVHEGKILRDWRGEAQPGVVDLYLSTQDSGLDAALEEAPGGH